MEIPTEEFLDSFCRTCNQQLGQTSSYKVNTTPAQQCHSIFNTIGETATLLIAELISNIIPQIEVELNDEMSKKICHKCYEQLQSIHRFQEMCIQTDQHMRQLIANLNMVIHLKDLLVQESHSEGGEENTIEYAPVNTIQLNIGERPQNSDDIKVENCSDSEVGDSVCVRNEPCDDNEPNVVQSDGRWSPSAVTIKNEMMSVNAEEVSLPSYIICKDKVLQQHKLHAPTEHSEEEYECPKCKKSFKTSGNLRRHCERHDAINAPTPKNKRYFCDICDKGNSFANAASWRRHMRTHTGEKP